MKRAILSAALAVAFVAGVAAQAKPNFAGNWQAEAPAGGEGGGGRRGGMGGGPQTITIEGNKMSISRTMGQGGNVVTTVYMLDGTPSKNMQAGRQGGEPTEVTYVSKWEGNVLVTTITAPNRTTTEKRSIEADGSMKVETTFTGQDGAPMSRSVTFKKITT